MSVVVGQVIQEVCLAYRNFSCVSMNESLLLPIPTNSHAHALNLTADPQTPPLPSRPAAITDLLSQNPPACSSRFDQRQSWQSARWWRTWLQSMGLAHRR
jgi:hypothetical protein